MTDNEIKKNIKDDWPSKTPCEFAKKITLTKGLHTFVGTPLWNFEWNMWCMIIKIYVNGGKLTKNN